MKNITEKTYYSGEDSDGNYRVCQFFFHDIPSPPCVPNLLNGNLVSLGISQRLQYLQSQIDKVIYCYNTTNIIEYKLSLESALVSMKRVIDDLIMSSYCILNSKEISETWCIEVDGYGALFNKGKPTKKGAPIIEHFLDHSDEYPQILSEIVNSIKHSYLINESQLIWGVDRPTVVCIYAHKNKYKNLVTYHNHSLSQILIGFNRLVTSIINKQRFHMNSCT